MFKLVVLSALVAVAVAKPQVHHSAIAYSAPNIGHSATFVAGSGPGSAISSSASSSVLNDGGFVANAAHAVAGPAVAYAVPGYHAFTTGPVASGYSTQTFASTQGSRYSTPPAYVARANHDAHNGREGQRADTHAVNNAHNVY